MSVLGAFEALLFPRQPFARLDHWIYSPLCLVIALTCARLTLEQPGR